MKSGSLIKVPLLLVVAFASSSFTARSTLPAHSLPIVQSASAPQVQIADEITRRLRRIGFSYIHSFGIRPSELAGDPC